MEHPDSARLASAQCSRASALFATTRAQRGIRMVAFLRARMLAHALVWTRELTRYLTRIRLGQPEAVGLGR